MDWQPERYEITAKWTFEWEGGNLFVLERIGDGVTHRYGPVPEDMAEPLIEERKREVSRVLQNYVHARHLPTPPKEQ